MNTSYERTCWQDEHAAGLDTARGERNTHRVLLLTLLTMGVEIVAGTVYGSMALLADGWHMGSHAAALSITAFSYWYARRHASNPRFTFGTGKVGALGGFASATALMIVALLMVVECVERLLSPVAIRFDQALIVAAVGLVVNLVSAWMLHTPKGHGHAHDHNLQAAFFHVLADALTSALAILALLAGRSLGWTWTDPAIGIVGAVIIARWSVGLLRGTSRVLLDADVDPAFHASIRAALEQDSGDRVVDVHLWRTAPGRLAGLVSVITHEDRDPEHYKAKLAELAGDDHERLGHVTVEVNRCGPARPQAV